VTHTNNAILWPRIGEIVLRTVIAHQVVQILQR